MKSAILAFVLSVAAGFALGAAPGIAITVSISILGAFIIYYLDQISKK